MPNSTLSEIVEQYQALAGKITPGKWEVNGATHIVKFGEDYASIAKVCNPREDGHDQSAPPVTRGHVMQDATIGNPRFHEAAANAEFIAFAANHFPTLVAELEKLQADKWADLRREHESARKLGAERQQVDELRAALARNQEALPDMWWLWDDSENDCEPEETLTENYPAGRIVRFQTAFRGPDKYGFWKSVERPDADPEQECFFFNSEAEAEAALSPSVPAAKENNVAPWEGK